MRFDSPAFGIVLLLVGGLLWGKAAPVSWGGAALVVVALGMGYEQLREHDRFSPLREFASRHRQRLLEATAILMVVTLATISHWDTSFGTRPVDHDHPVHYFKAWQTWEHLLSQGHLRGWSNRWFTGYPANYLYPVGGDLWVISFYVLGLGLISFGSAYGLSIWALTIVSCYSTYRLGKVYVGWGAGVFAALFFFADIGAFRYGGWTNTILWGVWPQALGTAFGVLALAEVPTILNRSSLPAMGRFALFFGVALLSHGASLILLGLALPPALMGLFALASGDRWRALGRGTAAVLLGSAIGGAWLFPFLDTKAFAGAFGRPWRHAEGVAKAIYKADLLKGSGWLVLALAAIGCLVLVRRRDWKAWYVVVVPLSLFALGNTTFLEGFGLDPGQGLLKNILFERMSIALKPFFFVLSGVGAVVAMRAIAQAGDVAAPGKRLHGLRLGVVVFLAAPVLAPLSGRLWDKNFSRELTPVEKRPRRADLEKVVARARELPDEGMWRWAFAAKKSHTYLDLAIDLGSPVYKRGPTPCAIFKYKVASLTSASLRTANVRYVLSQKKMRRKDFDLLEKVGSLYMYEFEGWSPDPFEILDGEGDVELVSLADEQVVLRASEGSKGELRLGMAHFPRWKATRDGTPLEIRAGKVRGVKRSGYMTVDLEPGEYRFTFERSALDHGSSILGILGFLGALLCIFGGAIRARLGRRAAGG